MIDVHLFRDPSKEYRAVPFQSWNDARDPADRHDGLRDSLP